MHDQSYTITRSQREQLNGHKGTVLWFTGLSGAGKSTIADGVEQSLHRRGKHTYTLDGDRIRNGLCRDLGFSPEDREENIRRTAEVARLMMDAGLIVITAFISPFRRDRECARQLIGPENFIEIHVSTPLDVCEQRDVKGLYRKARAGHLLNMTGIDSVYEKPEHPHASIDASVVSRSAAIEMVLNLLPD
jgi:bifunctional enzyme CysN/CysC